MKECAIKLNYALRFNFYIRVIDRFIFFPDIKQLVQSRTAPGWLDFKHTQLRIYLQMAYFLVAIVSKFWEIFCVSDGSPGIIVCDEGSVPNVCIKLEKIFVSIEILRKLWEGHTEITNSQPLLDWPRALVMSLLTTGTAGDGQLPSCMIRQKMDHLNKVSLKGPATFLQSLSAGHSIIILTGHYL